MKLRTISIVIAVALAGFAGAAAAAQSVATMPPVNVSGAAITQCLPPNDTRGHACDDFNQLVRANFTPREIGMLFGYQTSYPEFLTGGIDRLQRRYQAVIQQYLAAHQPSAATLVVSTSK